MTPHSDTPPLSPQQALERLQEGNRRFREVEGPRSIHKLHAAIASAPQRPFAIVLGCSDSRTPVEILFDQGFGDLFVVRIAGNIVAPSVVGSIEFAASEFGSRLVVVMGHTHCGAITATVEQIETGCTQKSRNISAITERIAPHIEDLVRAKSGEGSIREAMRANVRASAVHLRHGSRILEQLVLEGQLAVVGAEYEIDTGVVSFFDGVPDARGPAAA